CRATPPMTEPSRLRVALVDDEALARSVLREYLTSIPQVEIVAECSNGFEAVKAVTELKPDLLLLDVQMPTLDGFEVLELGGRQVAVVCVTGFDELALRAFEGHVGDFLVKPFSAARLAAAIGRARERLGRGERMPSPDLVQAARPAHGYAVRVLVRDGSK